MNKLVDIFLLKNKDKRMFAQFSMILFFIFLSACLQKAVAVDTLKIGEKLYSVDQVKLFLKEVYFFPDKRLQNKIARFKPKNNKLKYSVIFHPGVVPTNELKEQADREFHNAFDVFAKQTRMTFAQSNHSEADLIFIIANKFAGIGDLPSIKYIDNGHNPTESKKKATEEFWSKIDTPERLGGAFDVYRGFRYLLDNDIGLIGTQKMYYLLKIQNINQESIENLYSNSLCVIFLHYYVGSNKISDTCASKNQLKKSYSVSDFDLALINVIYQNKKLSNSDSADSINLILNKLIKKYGIKK